MPTKKLFKFDLNQFIKKNNIVEYDKFYKQIIQLLNPILNHYILK